MSDLQTGLIALGVVLLAAVLGVNWWQERRARQQMQTHFGAPGQDVLLDSANAPHGRREPGFGSTGPSASAASGAATQATTQTSTPDIDPTCEAVIDVSFAQPVPGLPLREAVQELLGHAMDNVIGKPVRTLVMDPYHNGQRNDQASHSTQIRADESYDAIQLAVLLANRQGALTDIDWSRAWGAAQQLAQRFDGVVEGPEQAAVLAQAQQLDALCAGLDGQVVLTLTPSPAQSPAQFAKRVPQQVEDMGFVLYGQEWVWMADSGLPWFALTMQGGDASARLNLVLDVPNCAVDETAFSRMASMGRTLAGKLHATLRDEQGQPLAPVAVPVAAPAGAAAEPQQASQADRLIDAQILKMHQALAAAGFVAGSWRTQQLFS